MSKLKVIVAGSADFYINEPADVFSVGVSTRVSFPVPDYFPDAILKSMEKAGIIAHLSWLMLIMHSFVYHSFWRPCAVDASGSAVLQGKVEYDLGTLLENTFKAHSAWSAEKTLATDLIFVDEKMKYLQKIAV